jgi:hypothetical protein
MAVPSRRIEMTFDEYLDANAVQLSQSLTAFQQQEAPKGFIDNTENGKLLIQCLLDNKMTPTVENLLACAKAHTSELGYKFYYTADEQALNAVRAQHTQAELDIFSHWYSYQHIEKNPRTEAAILSECRGHAIDRAFLDLALGRAATKGKVTFSKAPGQDNYIKGQYSGNEKLAKEDWKPEEMLDPFGKPIVNRQRGIAAQQYEAKLQREAEARPSDQQSVAVWKAKMESLQTQANTHSQRAQLRAILVTDKNGRVDYPATCAELERAIAAQGSR